MACFLAESRGNAAGQVTEVYRADIKIRLVCLFFRRFLLFRWKTLLRGYEFKDLRRRDGEPVGELEKAVKRNGLFCSLNPSYLVAVKVTHLRKLLLGETPFNS